MLNIDFTDFGNDTSTKPVGSDDNAAEQAAVLAHDAHALEQDSLTARTTYAVFSRQPVIVIDSPPGAGKTSLIVDVLWQVLNHSDLTAVVACPTRRGAEDVAARLAASFGSADDPHAPAPVLSGRDMVRAPGVLSSAPLSRRTVAVRTIESCARKAPEVDLLIVDEAYQTKYGDVLNAADGADQILMVGDPGQIGPVNRLDCSLWEGMVNGPHRRAPEVFAARPDALVMRLPASYRLGQETVDAIGVLYDFEFDSRRPERFVEVADSLGRVQRLAEITAHQTTATAGVHEVAPMKDAAALAAAYIGSTLVSTGRDGTVTRRQVEAEDVAVVVSHNVQSQGIKAILRSMNVHGITVGTADKMQGGEWPCVVALDPLIGHDHVSPHAVNAGRLCVMASRHTATMTWMHDGQGVEKLADAADELGKDAAKGVKVRERFLADA